MRHDLQINRLRALVAVVEHGGFRRAAEVLHITQPAVSQQIRQLSGLIKRPVFASTGRDMRLSPQGEELLEYARRMVALNDEAVARFVPEVGQVLLSVGVTSQLAEVLPEFLRRINRELPQVQLRVRTGASEALAEQLRTGQLDAALLLQTGPPDPGPDGLELGRMRMAWFGRPATGEHDALPLALFPAPCTLRKEVGEVLDRAGIRRRIAYEGPELIGLRSAAKAGLGMTCLIANGDELWGLARTARPDLPPPPAPLPVTLALTPGSAPAGFARTAEKAFRRALQGYPLDPAGPDRFEPAVLSASAA
ncbi:MULTISPECIES: LysR substrate-binding domain-containing protein [Streptomyces]|uniref:LysR substrate-binding domain-containing protein n=1 Tax=Streptomyces flavovirens TaxID=52258 RepID=A0ABV8NE52_9ACTN|nr:MULTISPECIES: LysR substrate-binding domain-containing protein [unclassified Streptomyces]MBK3594484.1 LysR family transcriptional regulator [Streptomyces sp. MBT51]MYX72678.1 LysR family transcriptional regulator [Streptomyces sp. SID3915]